jgi:glycerol kinase
MLLLALDQGTTSTRAILLTSEGKPLASDQRELPQIFPRSGWVEHDPEEIWRATQAVIAGALAKAGAKASDIAGLGITNQRETTIVWDRRTGKPIHNAIVWQDRRTSDTCEKLFAAGHGATFTAKTGLLLDPYFSGTKIAWILDQVAGARDLAAAGHLAFGTVDCFLLWRLTGGKVHATDATNASRSLLYDIGKGDWDDELCGLLNVPRSLLPKVVDSAGLVGHVDAALFGHAIPIAGIAGDQQAATVGQVCFAPGTIKSTYGTGCFVVLNTGETRVASKNKLLTTIAYQIGGKPTYAVEGSIFVAGASIQWLRDGLKLFASAGETQALAEAAPADDGVYLVPAFTGLGAPYWDAHARGAILGLSRDTGIATLVRAALEAVCYQTRDLLRTMQADGADKPVALRVDGGMTANDWAMQFLADILDVPVERPKILETTALGAAYLAGLGVGLYKSTDDLTRLWQRDRLFEPNMAASRRDRLYAGWREAVDRILTNKA